MFPSVCLAWGSVVRLENPLPPAFQEKHAVTPKEKGTQTSLSSFCASPQTVSQSAPQETVWLLLLPLPAFLCFFSQLLQLLWLHLLIWSKIANAIPSCPTNYSSQCHIVLSVKYTLACLFSFNKTLWSRKHCQLRFCYFRIFALNCVAPA